MYGHGVRVGVLHQQSNCLWDISSHGKCKRCTCASGHTSQAGCPLVCIIVGPGTAKLYAQAQPLTPTPVGQQTHTHPCPRLGSHSPSGCFMIMSTSARTIPQQWSTLRLI
jgi:hypothetical protein